MSIVTPVAKVNVVVPSPVPAPAPPSKPPAPRSRFFNRSLRRQQRATSSSQFLALIDVLDRLDGIGDELRGMIGDHWYGCRCVMCGFLDGEYGTGWRQDLITLESVTTMYRASVECALPMPMMVDADGVIG